MDEGRRFLKLMTYHRGTNIWHWVVETNPRVKISQKLRDKYRAWGKAYSDRRHNQQKLKGSDATADLLFTPWGDAIHSSTAPVAQSTSSAPFGFGGARDFRLPVDTMPHTQNGGTRSIASSIEDVDSCYYPAAIFDRSSLLESSCDISRLETLPMQGSQGAALMSDAAAIFSPSALQERIQNSPKEYRNRTSDQSSLSVAHLHVRSDVTAAADYDDACTTHWAAAQLQQASSRGSGVHDVTTTPFTLSQLQQDCGALSAIEIDSCILPFFDEEENGVAEPINAVDKVSGSSSTTVKVDDDKVARTVLLPHASNTLV